MSRVYKVFGVCVHVVRVLSSQLRFGQAGSGPVAAGGAEHGRGWDTHGVRVGVLPEPAPCFGNVRGSKGSLRQRDQACSATGEGASG